MQRIKPGEEGYKYSFSTLSAAFECPYMVYLQKIEDHRDEEVPNIFAEIGTLTHNLLDEWSKGEIEQSDLSMVFAERFEEEVVTPAPANLEKYDYRNKQKQLGIDFFDNFDGFKGFTVLGAEERFETELDGRKFVGCVDMILQDNNTGALIVCDHKSKSKKAFLEAEDEMYRQQYLYSKYIYEQFGRYPDFLMFHLFKENGEKVGRRFDKDEYDRVIQWAIDTIHAIESWDMFDWQCAKEQPDDGQPDFFCTTICSMRNICDNGQKKYKPKGKK